MPNRYEGADNEELGPYLVFLLDYFDTRPCDFCLAYGYGRCTRRQWNRELAISCYYAPLKKNGNSLFPIQLQREIWRDHPRSTQLRVAKLTTDDSTPNWTMPKYPVLLLMLAEHIIVEFHGSNRQLFEMGFSYCGRMKPENDGHMKNDGGSELLRQRRDAWLRLNRPVTWENARNDPQGYFQSLVKNGIDSVRRFIPDPLCGHPLLYNAPPTDATTSPPPPAIPTTPHHPQVGPSNAHHPATALANHPPLAGSQFSQQAWLATPVQQTPEMLSQSQSGAGNFFSPTTTALVTPSVGSVQSPLDSPTAFLFSMGAEDPWQSPTVGMAPEMETADPTDDDVFVWDETSHLPSTMPTPATDFTTEVQDVAMPHAGGAGQGHPPGVGGGQQDYYQNQHEQQLLWQQQWQHQQEGYPLQQQPGYVHPAPINFNLGYSVGNTSGALAATKLQIHGATGLPQGIGRGQIPALSPEPMMRTMGWDVPPVGQSPTPRQRIAPGPGTSALGLVPVGSSEWRSSGQASQDIQLATQIANLNQAQLALLRSQVGGE